MHIPRRSRRLELATSALLVAVAAAGLPIPPTPESQALLGNLDVRLEPAAGLASALSARAGATARQRAALERQQTIAAALTELTTQHPGTVVEVSPVSGGIALLHNPSGPLSGPAAGVSGEVFVRRFLSTNHAAFGLEASGLEQLVILGDSPGGRSGLRMVRVEQRLDGISVFGSETRFLIDRPGQVWRVLGGLVPDLAASAVHFEPEHLTSPAAALVNMFAATGHALELAGIAAHVRPQPAGVAAGEPVELTGPPPLAGPANARLVWFPLVPGVLVPAWSLTVFTSTEADWYAVVDAETGQTLWRKNIRENASSHPARFAVYVAADGTTPADSPAPQSPSPAVTGNGTQFPSIDRTIVAMFDAQSLSASPNGWIDDCPASPNPGDCDVTRGNNVDACIDRDATDNTCDTLALDVAGRPSGNPDAHGRSRDFLGSPGTLPGALRDFDYTPPPQAGNPNAGDTPTNPDYQRGAVTQAFYVANWYHDRLFALGFDEPAGNFQQTNHQGLGGLAGDRIAVDVQNLGSNVGRFATPADGAGPGRLDVSLFPGPAPDRDGSLDAEILLHELTHGLSGRLIGNGAGLLWDPGRAMGEGWSDFYPLALLNATPSDDPNGRYAMIGYASYRLNGAADNDNYVYGFRRFPYTTDNAVNPLTWADVDDVTAAETGGIAPNPANLARLGGMEVHNAGTLWALSLWEVRSRIIADPAGANGNVTVGNETMLQLVTDAIKMTPSQPSFIAGREALFAADCATVASCPNETALWQGFADRGFGYGAAAPLGILGGRPFVGRAHMGFRESFLLPHLDIVDPSLDVVIDDSPSGNGNGYADPGETVSLIVTLTNPWRASARQASGITATLSSSTPGVTVPNSIATYAPIVPQATAANPAAPFVIVIPANAPCGQRLHFDLTTTSSLGPGSTQFSLRLGEPVGAGSAVTFGNAPSLTIPDNRGDGVVDSIEVSDDLEIADLDLVLTSLPHQKTGDLTVMLRAPNGYGTDLIWRRGLTSGGLIGANFVDTVIDDDLPLVAANDLMASATLEAPFSGDWLPAFNSPSFDTAPVTPPMSRDPVGQLSRLDGTSTFGTWSLNVADVIASNTGSLASWAIRVTPRTFACASVQEPLLVDGFESGDTSAW